MRSIFVKIFLVFSVVIMLSSGLLLFFSLRTIQRHYLKGVLITLKTNSKLISYRVIPLIKKRKFSELKKLTEEICEQTGLYIELKSKGKDLAPSCHNLLSRKEFLFVTVPLVYHGKKLGELKLGMPLNSINAELDKLSMEISLITIGLICLCLGIAFVFSRSISNAVNRLTAATKEVAQGNFDIALDWNGNDEFKILADNFNNMVSKIRELIRGLVNKQEEVNGIISLLQEGLIVIDEDGKIIACNEAFKDLIGKENVVGGRYKDIFNIGELSDFIDKAVERGQSFREKLKLEGRNFLCNVSFLAEQNKVIITMQDLSGIDIGFK